MSEPAAFQNLYIPPHPALCRPDAATRAHVVIPRRSLTAPPPADATKPQTTETPRHQPLRVSVSPERLSPQQVTVPSASNAQHHETFVPPLQHTIPDNNTADHPLPCRLVRTTRCDGLINEHNHAA